MSENSRAVPGCTDAERGVALEAYLERRLSRVEEAGFEDHFFGCAACLEEIRLRQGLPAALRKTRSRHLDVPRWLAPAGAIAVALLVYTSYLGLIELPEAKGRVGLLNDEVAGLKTSVQELNAFRDASRWAGPVYLAVLSGPTRAGQIRPEIVRLSPGQPFVPLAAMATLPPIATPDDPFRFQIRSADDMTVWEIEMKASRIRQALDADRVVTFLIPADKLVTGEYRFLLNAAAGGTSEPIWQARFSVRAAD